MTTAAYLPFLSIVKFGRSLEGPTYASVAARWLCNLLCAIFPELTEREFETLKPHHGEDIIPCSFVNRFLRGRFEPCAFEETRVPTCPMRCHAFGCERHSPLSNEGRLRGSRDLPSTKLDHPGFSTETPIG